MILVQTGEQGLHQSKPPAIYNPFVNFIENRAEFVELNAAAVIRIMLQEQLITDFV